MALEIYFLIRFITKINNCFREKKVHHLIINVKGNWVKRKMHEQELKSLQYLGYYESILIILP